MKKVLKVLGVVVLGLVLVLVGFVTVATRSFAKAESRRFDDVEGPMLDVRYDAESLARGEHLAKAVSGCTECHGENLGGRVFIDDPGLGRITGPNLTRGRNGRGARLGDADWSRAIVRGVGDHRRPLIMMPSRDYVALSTTDLAAIIAWARTRPNVDSDLPTTELKPLAKVLQFVGKANLFAVDEVDLHAPPIAAAPPAGRTSEYGAYLAQVCSGCHRADFRGGPMVGAPPGVPDPANLTPTQLSSWNEAEFTRVFREGKARDGHALQFMPWQSFKQMSDDELGAIWLFLRSIPAQPTGT